MEESTIKVIAGTLLAGAATVVFHEIIIDSYKFVKKAIIRRFSDQKPSDEKDELANADLSRLTVPIHSNQIEKNKELEESVDDLSRLPIPTHRLIGRDRQLTEIEESFDDEKISVVSIIAAGGVGKSALTYEFVNNKLKAQSFKQTKKIFAWSFYSQGSHTTYIDSSEFFRESLKFFGLNNVIEEIRNEINTARLSKQAKNILTKLTTIKAENILKQINDSKIDINSITETIINEVLKGTGDKAEQLIELINTQKSLIILDGLEPLQNPPEVDNGRFIDYEINKFITRFALNGLKKGGLILISSRQKITEIEHEKVYHKEIELKNFTEEDEKYGIELLKSFENIKGNDEHLKKINRKYFGHPLSLVLIGNMLVKYYAGNSIDIDFIQNLIETKYGDNDGNRQFKRIIKFYMKIWEDKNQNSYKIFMFLLSLFDRPISKQDELYALKQDKNSIAKELPKKNIDFNELIFSLCKLSLLSKREGKYEGEGKDEYDAHPLIRETFVQEFKKERRKDFIQANLVMYQYFMSCSNILYKNTLLGLEKYYRAVFHATKADKYEKAYDTYWDYISKGTKFESLRRYGAISKNLTLFRYFFNTDDDDFKEEVIKNLPGDKRISLRRGVVHHLMTLGWMRKALDIAQIELKETELTNDYYELSDSYARLIEIENYSGKLHKAIKHGEESIKIAEYNIDKEKKLFWNMISRSRLAYAYQNGGELKKAKSLYKKVIILRNEYLNFISGNKDINIEQAKEEYYGKPHVIWEERRHSLLLEEQLFKFEEELNKIEAEIEENLEYHKKANRLAYIALNYENRAKLKFKRNKDEEAIDDIKKSVSTMKQSGKSDLILQLLITQSKLYYNIGKKHNNSELIEDAKIILKEINNMLRFIQIETFRIDANLLEANILLDSDKKEDIEKARKFYNKLNNVMNEKYETDGGVPYYLRKKELQSLKERIESL
jgi:hypothetical protein